MKKNIISPIIASIIACVVTCTMLHNKPPNLRPYKRHKVHINHKMIERKAKIITHVTLTCYQPISSQCDKEPLTTSDGSKINLKHLKRGKIKWCAISRDLLYLFTDGKNKVIWIDGYGVYEVRDIMNRRYRHSVDLLIHPKNGTRIKKDNIKVIIY